MCKEFCHLVKIRNDSLSARSMSIILFFFSETGRSKGIRVKFWLESPHRKALESIFPFFAG